MRIKNSRIISFLLILALSIQITGCLGITDGTPSKPNDVLLSLTNTIREYRKDDFLNLLMLEKGSSIYKEYDEILDLDSYTSDAAKCYKAVASAIDVRFEDSDIETGSGIVKAKVKFLIPEWKAVFEDSSLSGADSVIEAISKAEKEKVSMTLRLIETKDGLKIKNYEDVMEVFDFVGYEIAGLSGEPVPSRETDPSESKPTETAPRSSDPAGTTPSETKDPTGANRKTAYGEYAKIIAENKSDIEWYEKTFNKHSCGMTDFNGDNVPELFFFSKSKYSEDYVNFFVYTYNTKTQKTSMVLVETLTQAGSDISEFFVSRTNDGHLVTYRGYLSEGSAILTYNLYASAGTSALTFTGNMFCTITPSIKDKDGKEINSNVCALTGVDKYKERTSVDLEEFRRVEKAVLSDTGLLLSANFQKSPVSAANEILGKYDSTALSVSDLLNILSM